MTAPTAARGPTAPKVNEVGVAVIGAGPQGLAAALHLLEGDPGLHRELVVLDPAGGWLRAWDGAAAPVAAGALR